MGDRIGSLKQVVELQDKIRELERQNKELQRQLAEANGRADALQARITEQAAKVAMLNQTLFDTASKLESQVMHNPELPESYKHAVNNAFVAYHKTESATKEFLDNYAAGVLEDAAQCLDVTPRGDFPESQLYRMASELRKGK